MKFLYIALALLPVLAAAAPVPAADYPKPSGYPYGKRASDSAFAKRQVTVADLKRRAEEGDSHKPPSKPSGYYPRATDA